MTTEDLRGAQWSSRTDGDLIVLFDHGRAVESGLNVRPGDTIRLLITEAKSLALVGVATHQHAFSAR
jgi:hypothetical protein